MIFLESSDSSIKRGRGRPKKIIETETEPIVINSSSENEETINERRRGSPSVSFSIVFSKQNLEDV